jgi:hypothetical protein
VGATFYWYAWILTIIVFFFIEKTTLRYDLLFFTGIAMCTYTLMTWSPASHLYIHVSLLLLFGTHIWIRRKRAFFHHFWPFILSVGYASIWMFFVIHPVWSNFPGVSFGLVVAILLLRMIIADIEGLIGSWLLINAGGTLFSYGIFAIYGNEGLIESQMMMLFALKGLLVFFLFYGIDHLKRLILKKKKSSSKGAALV